MSPATSVAAFAVLASLFAAVDVPGALLGAFAPGALGGAVPLPATR